MATITVKPNALHYRYESNKWSNYQRMYDGDLGTYVTSMSCYAYFRIDLSGVPSGSVLTSVRYEIKYYRSSTQAQPHLELGYTNSTGNTNITRNIGYADLSSQYQQEETISGTGTITTDQSTALLSATYPLIYFANVFSGRLYEVTLYFTYTPPAVTFNNIRVGNTQVKEVYVGSTQVKEIYVGSTRIL